MRRWCAATGAVGLAAVGLVSIGAVLLLRGGISATAEPSAFETRIARTLRSWAIPSHAREASNPIPSSPRVLALITPDDAGGWFAHCGYAVQPE